MALPPDAINTAFKVSVDDFDDVMWGFNQLVEENFGSILSIYQDNTSREGTVVVATSPTNYSRWNLASQVRSPSHHVASTLSSPVTVEALYESVRVTTPPARSVITVTRPAAPAPAPPSAYEVLDRSGVAWYVHTDAKGERRPNFQLKSRRAMRGHSRAFLQIDKKILDGCEKLTGSPDELFDAIAAMASAHYSHSRVLDEKGNVSKDYLPAGALLFKK